MKLSYFVSPLYMAYSYEESQGPQHIQLAQLLDDTSFYLNSTFQTLRNKVGNWRDLIGPCNKTNSTSALFQLASSVKPYKLKPLAKIEGLQKLAEWSGLRTRRFLLNDFHVLENKIHFRTNRICLCCFVGATPNFNTAWDCQIQFHLIFKFKTKVKNYWETLLRFFQISDHGKQVSRTKQSKCVGSSSRPSHSWVSSKTGRSQNSGK